MSSHAGVRLLFLPFVAAHAYVKQFLLHAVSALLQSMIWVTSRMLFCKTSVCGPCCRSNKQSEELLGDNRLQQHMAQRVPRL